MTSSKKTSRPQSVAALEAAVRRHNQLYFVEQRPEISDSEFDALVEELRARAPESSVLHAIGSDTRDESATMDDTVTHRVPMLSLEKCYTTDDLIYWAEKLGDDFVLSPKIDGMAITLHYDARGALIQAATRGSGVRGENITANMRALHDVPHNIDLHNVEIRGEIFMPLSTFAKRYEEEFMSPRNLAAGAVKQKDPQKTGESGVQFLAYDLLGTDATTEIEKRKRLSHADFRTVPTKQATIATLAATCAVFEQERKKLDYEIDGIVVRLNSVAAQARLGNTAHHPRYAMAFKFASENATTTVRDIEWSVSRSQIITPIALIEPVELSGAMIARVSLHNFGLASKSLIGEGARVIVVRRGGVIPHIEQVVTPAKNPLTPPKKCPSCHAPTKLEADFVYCTNDTGCVRARIGALKHFLDTIACEGFGPKLLAKLVEGGLANDPADLYALDVDTLLQFERMGETLAQKLITNLAAKRELPLELFLQSLGIPELARHAAKILASYGSIAAVRALTEVDLAAQYGLGEKTAAMIVQGIKDSKPLIDKLLRVVHIIASPTRMQHDTLQGKSFLFTGALAAFERKQAQALVEQFGGRIASGVSGTLDFLVIGDDGGAGGKLKKARALSEAPGAKLRILNETEFLHILREAGANV